MVSNYIRHAFQGDRNVKLVDNGANDELMKWHSMVMPQQKALTEFLKDKDESNIFQKITITRERLKEYFPVFYTKSQMEKVLFDLLGEWKKTNLQYKTIDSGKIKTEPPKVKILGGFDKDERCCR